MVTDWGYPYSINLFIAIVGSLFLLAYFSLNLFAIWWVLWGKHLTKNSEYRVLIYLWFLQYLIVPIAVCIRMFLDIAFDIIKGSLYQTLIFEHEMPPIRHAIVLAVSLLMIGLYVLYVRKIKVLLDRESE